jgi:hypothetical protein
VKKLKYDSVAIVLESCTFVCKINVSFLGFTMIFPRMLWVNFDKLMPRGKQRKQQWVHRPKIVSGKFYALHKYLLWKATLGSTSFFITSIKCHYQHPLCLRYMNIKFGEKVLKNDDIVLTKNTQRGDSGCIGESR